MPTKIGSEYLPWIGEPGPRVGEPVDEQRQRQPHGDESGESDRRAARRAAEVDDGDQHQCHDPRHVHERTAASCRASRAPRSPGGSTRPSCPPIGAARRRGPSAFVSRSSLISMLRVHSHSHEANESHGGRADRPRQAFAATATRGDVAGLRTDHRDDHRAGHPHDRDRTHQHHGRRQPRGQDQQAAWASSVIGRHTAQACPDRPRTRRSRSRSG